MSTQLIPFDSAKLPVKAKAIANPFSAVAAVGGFPALSVKGSKFHVIRGDTRETLMRDVDGEKVPATSIEVVILDVNPNKSFTFFKEGFKEGSSAGPVCFSNNAKNPDPNAKEPQAKSCESCPHRVWGSKVYDNGKKGRACEESVRMAVAPLGQVNDAMLLRIKGGSFTSLREFGEYIGKRGKNFYEVATKISFDHEAAYPLFVFKPIGILPPNTLAEVEDVRAMEVVKQITGVAASDVHVEEDADGEEKFESKQSDAPAAKPVRAAKPVADDEDDLPAEPKAKVTKGEPKEEAKPAAKKASVEAVADEVGEMISGDADDLDFDD